MRTFYTLAQMERDIVKPEYSTAEGPTIKGKNVEVGFYRYPAGSGATTHAHPQEQVITVLKGRIRSKVLDKEKILGVGEAVYIPANAEHSNWAVDEEAEFISCKNVLGSEEA